MGDKNPKKKKKKKKDIEKVAAQPMAVIETSVKKPKKQY